MTTKPITPEQRDAILAGLNELKTQGKRIGAKRGPKHVRVQLFMTAAEHRALFTIRAATSLQVGRIVSLPLCARLALVDLAGRCGRALADPVEAAKLRASLLDLRNERLIG
jgi:hypothetical protein